MLYREAGQFKTSYAADMAVFPLVQDRVGIAVIVAGAYLIGFVGSDFLLQAVMIPFLVFSLAAIGLNILTGYAGLLSLGTGAFMGVGAYACYKLTSLFPGVNIVVWILVVGLTWVASNLVHGRIGRMWMAIRDMDIAAELMGIRLLPAKLLAFAVSSYYCGVAGAAMAFLWYGGAEYDVFNINQSFF